MLAILTSRISDAQFSDREAERIRRAARRRSEATCPRCGRQLTVVPGGREMLETGQTLLRCEGCRRFVVVP
jgi:hypothetical protein